MNKWFLKKALKSGYSKTQVEDFLMDTDTSSYTTVVEYWAAFQSWWCEYLGIPC